MLTLKFEKNWWHINQKKKKKKTWETFFQTKQLYSVSLKQLNYIDIFVNSLVETKVNKQCKNWFVLFVCKRKKKKGLLIILKNNHNFLKTFFYDLFMHIAFFFFQKKNFFLLFFFFAVVVILVLYIDTV